MNWNTVTSVFLFFLLLGINWHNTFLHSHTEFGSSEAVVIHHHGHDHVHNHHHDRSVQPWWKWLKHLLGNFEHPDMGDHHLELFLPASFQPVVNQIPAVYGHPFIDCIRQQRMDDFRCQKNLVPVSILSCSDPPFRDGLRTRGPPEIS